MTRRSSGRAGLLAVSVVCATLALRGRAQPDAPHSTPSDANPAPLAVAPSIPPWNDSELSEAARTIIARGAARAYPDRLKAVRVLGRNLAPRDVDALLAFLRQPSGVYTNLSAGQLNTVKNDVLDALLRQELVPDALAGQVLLMATAPESDATWRQYCVQHLPELRKELARCGKNGGPQVTAALWAAADTNDGGIVGAALLGLERMAAADSEAVPSGRLADKAVAIATDLKAPAPARTTAFQVAAHLGDRRILDVARTDAGTAASIPLRLSAIAALGQVGLPGDAAILETIATGETEDKYVKGAAVTGLRQLRSRNDLKQTQ